MRINASFVRPPRTAGPLTFVLWLVAFAFGGLAAWFAFGVVTIKSEQPRLEARLARLNEQLALAAPREPLPSLNELDALRARVKTVNSISKLRGWSAPQLLAWFERNIADDVYLVSLHHKAREGEALLVAESPSAEALTALLLRLEREPRFAEVLLTKQGTRSTETAKVVQFEIRVRLVS